MLKSTHTYNKAGTENTEDAFIKAMYEFIAVYLCPDKHNKTCSFYE